MATELSVYGSAGRILLRITRDTPEGFQAAEAVLSPTQAEALAHAVSDAADAAAGRWFFEHKEVL